MKYKAREYKTKMSKEELQTYLQTKRSGNGAHRSKKDYRRTCKHPNREKEGCFFVSFFSLANVV